MPLKDIHLSPCEAILLISQEIRSLQLRIARLEHGMEAFYSSDKAGLGHVTITALQELDMLAQSTEAIATYMADLSHRLDDDTPIDLTPELTAIPLRELGHRLGGFKQVTLTANSPELF